jgi:hypothetical protein
MLPNSGVEAAVSRPVTLDIANQVMDILQIPKETRIIFKGSSDSVYQSGSLVTDQNNDPHTAGSSYLNIEVTERFIEESLGTIAVYQPEHTPYFYDDKLGIAGKMVYIPTEVDINFRYKTRSKALAGKIRNDTWARVSNMRDVNVHTVTYNMPILPAFVRVLRYLHALRENVEGYNENFEEYFLSYASPAITQISKMDGTGTTYSLQETATRILGMFEFTGAPNSPEKDGEGSTYNVEFSYKFTYEKPTNQVLKFPVAIHNQLVDQRLIDHDSTNLAPKRKFYSSSIKHMRQFEVDHILDQHVNDNRAIYIPRYDDITYENKVGSTETLFSAICSVEDNDPMHLLNLNELGDFQFSQLVLDYIREVDYQYIYKPYQSFINVSHYRNSYLASHESLYVDEDLNFYNRRGLNKRVINRVRISIAKTILDVDPKAVKRLVGRPEVLRALVLATETNRVHLERLRPVVDVTHLFKDLPNIGSPRSLYDTNRVQWNTVMSSGVIAKNIEHKSNRGRNIKLHEQIYGSSRN